MKKYITIFILDDKKSDISAESFISQLETNIKEFGGTIVETNNMGIKELAHPIKKNNTGLYLDVVVNLPKDKVILLKDKYHLDTS